MATQWIHSHRAIRLIFAALMAVASTACQSGETSRAGGQSRSGGNDVRVKRSVTSPTALAGVSHPGRSGWSGLGDIIIKKSLDEVEDSNVSVLYSPGDGIAVCTFQISEQGKVVAQNSDMIECGLMTRSMVNVAITGDSRRMLVVQQKERESNKYSLERTPSGVWVITRVEFIYPQENPETGDMEVFREVGGGPGKPFPISVGKYDRDEVDGFLLKTAIQ